MSLDIVSVHASAKHAFSKGSQEAVQLVAGWGVEGDAHAGTTDQHLYHIRRFGRTPNLNQVHLIPVETLAEVAEKGFSVQPGELGENISTQGIDLVALPTGTRLRLGQDAVLELTGLRDPCIKIDKLQRGLMAQLIERRPTGIVRKCGVMSVVLASGAVRPGDSITVELPALPHRPLIYVKPTAAVVP